MIAIINTTRGKPHGHQTYDLLINRKKIVTFAHIREEGLARCLRCAADAVEKMENEM